MRIITQNIFKLGGNICELLYYKISLVGVKFGTAWNDYKEDYDRSVRRVIEPRYIVDESYDNDEPTYSGEPAYTNPIIQKEKGFI